MNAANNLNEPILAALAAKFEDEADVDYPRGLIHQMVMNGTYNFTITGDGTPQYAFWHSTLADKRLHAHAGLSLSNYNKRGDFFKNLDSIARGQDCTGIVFETNKPGLIREALRHRYRQSAVVLRKDCI